MSLAANIVVRKPGFRLFFIFLQKGTIKQNYLFRVFNDRIFVFTAQLPESVIIIPKKKFIKKVFYLFDSDPS